METPESIAEPEQPEGTRLVLVMVKQAMADLDDPAERDDAVLFLTETLWDGDPEGLPLREMAPMFFEHEAEMRERIRLMIAGEIVSTGALGDEDGVMGYDDCLAHITKGGRHEATGL